MISNEPIVSFIGTIENIIFKNDENGFTVFSLSIESELPENSKDWQEEDELICTGYLPRASEGETVTVSGSYVIHPTYGKQLKVEAYERAVPNTLQGIEKYLASGVIKGIGERLAKKIVKKFGENTLTVLEDYPEKLAELKGITLEKAMGISALYNQQADLRRAMLFLQDYGISPVYAMKIYKTYGDRTIDAVKANPYSLSQDIYGIGFKTADAIAFKVGVPFDSPYRVQAGIRYVLNLASTNGHVYLPKPLLVRRVAELLGIDERFVGDNLLQMQVDRAVVLEKIWEDQSALDETDAGFHEAVYLHSFFYMEGYVARRIVELSGQAADRGKNIKEEIRMAEDAASITLAEKQRLAVEEAMTNGVMIITGGPGTGKTTIINTIIRIIEKDGHTIELAAPTGRAAKRMSEATGMEAKTLHRLLGLNYMAEDGGRQSFTKDEGSPIEAGVIIVDESSMIDINLMYHFMKAVALGTRLIFVGDVDQLPSVGPGNVLKDVIQSGCLPVVRLTEIFRQSQESAIVMNAHRINRGEYPVLNDKNKDFFFLKRMTPEQSVDAIIELVMKRLPAYARCDNVRDIQILSPMRKSALGVTALNKLLQNSLNPSSARKNEKEFRDQIYREGDKVMQIKNNYNITWKVYGDEGALVDEGTGVFNGDCGTIQKINDENHYVRVLFDDNKLVDYDYSQLDELELSYAVTIHKSQGCEYRVVVIPIHSGPPMLMSRNLLYTAVTRAKELAVIVGVPEALYRMVDNNKEENRYTALNGRLRKISAMRL